MYWFKRKYRQIKRVLDYLPIIWKGYDFDYRYATELFTHQLGRMADHFESDRAMTLCAGDKAKRIRTAIKLMNKVYEEEYGMEYLDTIELYYGKETHEFIETDEVSKRSGEKYFTVKITNELAVDEQHQKEISEVRHQLFLLSNEKQKKAHGILWKFIEHNIQRWWDQLMKFRSGKYAGLTVEHVKKIAPWYIQWVRENRPEMLRDRSPKPKPYKKPVYIDPPDIPKEGAIKPNYDFDNMF